MGFGYKVQKLLSHKVYAPNGTLIKTSSFANRFVVKHSGAAQLATTIKDNRIQQLTAIVRFMTNL